MANAAIKPSAEAACRLCRGRAVKTEGQRLMAKILKGRFYKLGRGDFEGYFERIFQPL